jgi:hypothetical protein
VISIPDCDQRLLEHLVRAAAADREGWMREAARDAGDARPREGSPVVALVRRHLGDSLVGIGERLSGTPASHAADPAKS